MLNWITHCTLYGINRCPYRQCVMADTSFWHVWMHIQTNVEVYKFESKGYTLTPSHVTGCSVCRWRVINLQPVTWCHPSHPWMQKSQSFTFPAWSISILDGWISWERGREREVASFLSINICALFLSAKKSLDRFAWFLCINRKVSLTLVWWLLESQPHKVFVPWVPSLVCTDMQ